MRLQSNKTLIIPGYNFYAHNSNVTRVNDRKGSGDVYIFVKDLIYDSHDILMMYVLLISHTKVSYRYY